MGHDMPTEPLARSTRPIPLFHGLTTPKGGEFALEHVVGTEPRRPPNSDFECGLDNDALPRPVKQLFRTRTPAARPSTRPNTKTMDTRM